MPIVPRFGAGHRILVSGGAGFVPSHVVDALIERGCRVVAVDNFLTGSDENVAHLADHPLFTLVKHDVCDGLPEHHPALAGRFDAILHMASPASPKDFTTLPVEILRVGSLGTLHLLDRAVTDRARFLLASTSEAYGDPLVHPQPESYWGNVNPIGVRSVYDEAKRFAEAATMAYRRSRVWTPPSCGSSTRSVRGCAPTTAGRSPPSSAQALQGEPSPCTGPVSRPAPSATSTTWSRGILLLLDSEEPGPINCGTEHEISIRDLAQRIVTLAGSESEVRLRRPHGGRSGDAPPRPHPRPRAVGLRSRWWSRRTGCAVPSNTSARAYGDPRAGSTPHRTLRACRPESPTRGSSAGRAGPRAPGWPTVPAGPGGPDRPSSAERTSGSATVRGCPRCDAGAHQRSGPGARRTPRRWPGGRAAAPAATIRRPWCAGADPGGVAC